MTDLLDLATARLRAWRSGGPSVMAGAEVVQAVWSAATEAEKAALSEGLIPTRDGDALLPSECLGMFVSGAFQTEERGGSKHEGLNIGVLIGLAVDQGRELETAFEGLIEVSTSTGPRLAGPLACAVALCITESRASVA